MELWQIDGSRPAPYFSLVASPNDWRKENVRKAVEIGPSRSSERGERYREFFQKLIDALREDHSFTGARKGQPQSWYSFSIGYGQKVTCGANFTGDKRARIEVYIDAGDGETNLRLLRKLEEYKSQIESEVGQSLEWDPLENSRACRIEASIPGSIDDDDGTLSEIHDWMVVNLLSFKKAFEPHLRKELGRP